LDGLATLVVEGDASPASRIIAEKAGVTQRTLFNHFDHLDALYAEMGQRQFEHLAGALPEAQASGTLEQRVDHELDALAAIHERFGPIHRAIDARNSDHPSIAEFLELVRVVRTTRLQRAFGVEISAMGGRDHEIITSLLAVTSEGLWYSVRHDLGCDVRRSRSIVTGLVHAVLSGAINSAVERSASRELDLSVLEVLDLGDKPAVIDLATDETRIVDR